MTENVKSVTALEVTQMIIDTENQLEKERLAMIRDKESYKDLEASAWLLIPFKEKGATNEKMRNALVREHMNTTCPPTYKNKEGKVKNLEDRIKMLQIVLDVMDKNKLESYPFKGLNLDTKQE